MEINKKTKDLLWKLQLKDMAGKEFVKEKKKVQSGNSYLKQHKKKNSGNKKNVPMTSLRSGKTPATQKQITYIGILLKKSKKKYDYNYHRDKYVLDTKLAGLFISAIEKQQDFKICNYSKASKKAFAIAKAETERLEQQLDVILGINND